MHKAVAMSLTLLLTLALAAGAHQGKTHRLLGTVKEVRENRLTVTIEGGKERSVELTDATRYESEGKSATRADLTPGRRVSVHLSEDDTKAVVIKIAPASPSH
jgi:hypothetical protein